MTRMHAHLGSRFVRRWLAVAIAILALPGAAQAAMQPRDLRCEYLVDPLGIDEQAPRLSWTLASRRRGEAQTAYRILVAGSPQALKAGRGDLWDTGRVAGARTTQIVYAGKPLASGQRCFWKVRCWDRDGKASAYSAPAWWEMALLQPDEWRGASWIGLEKADGKQEVTLDHCRWIWFAEPGAPAAPPAGSRYFRKRFDLPAGARVKRAALLLTVDDQFVLHVNGMEAGKSDGQADAWRRPVLVDMAPFLSPGPNVLAVAARNDGGPAGFVGRLLVEVEGGKLLQVDTDRSWKASDGEQAGWREPGFDDDGWPAAADLGDMGKEPWGIVGGPGSEPKPSPYLRKSFTLDGQVRSARVYVTALGWYRLFLNGKPVGTDVLAPGWTDYRKRVEYQTHDVTRLLRKGENVVGALLGEGWYCGPLGWSLARNHFGSGPPRLRLQLLMEQGDGEETRVATDESWRGVESPIRSSDIYGGEVYDARLEQPGWDRPGFDDSQWRPATALEGGDPKLVAQRSQGIQVTEELPAAQVTELKPGVFLFDLGQNIAGWARLRVRGPAGTEVTLRFGEELKPDGTLYVENLRRARATDVYILKGEGTEVFEPHFTYHGFRYVEVTGYPGKPALDAVLGRVVHSAAPVAGSFECSDPTINRLVRNIDWGLRANIMSVPTDCPQRDERLGWTGDTQAFARTSCFLRDMAPFYTKWMDDLVEAQSAEGAFSNVAPRAVAMGDSSPGWADAGVIIPWTLYQCYGDTRILERHFDAMARYVDLIYKRNPDGLWLKGRGSDYGDWVAAGGKTPKELIASAYFAYDAALLARMARAIGRDADARKYADLAEATAAAFRGRFLKPDGRVESESQTAYALALAFGLVPEAQVPAVGARLVEAVERHNGHLSTGFLGTGVLLPALTDTGSLDTAYRLLNNRTYPSWLYMVEKGATTIWELWTSDKAGPGMNSRNHFAFGCVGEWLQRYAAGIEIDPDAPGYRRVRLQPHPGGGLTFARATTDTLHGRIESGWRLTDGGVLYTFSLPANTTASVRIPKQGRASLRILDGRKPVWQEGRFVPGAGGITAAREEKDVVFLEVGSGSYALSVNGR